MERTRALRGSADSADSAVACTDRVRATGIEARWPATADLSLTSRAQMGGKDCYDRVLISLSNSSPLRHLVATAVSSPKDLSRTACRSLQLAPG